MAISTTLFAPQVPIIQPAFIISDTEGVGGEANIYFSLSQYNNDGQFSSISYKIIDPNKSAAWGTNVITSGEVAKGKPLIPISKYGQYCFTIGSLGGLTKNQYYQIQITLHNGADESLPSQVSLLRPIPEVESSTINQSNVLLLDRISGSIEYVDGSQVEQIHTYWVELKRSAETIYKSKVITNTFGTSFNSTIDDCFVTGSNLSLIVHYTTINGYSGEISKPITIGEWTTGLTISNSKVIAQPEKGSIRLEGILEGISGSGILKIQRSSEEYDYLDWRNVYEDEVDSLGSFIWEDTTVESQAKYKYRIAFEADGNIYAKTIDTETIVNYDSIYLQDKDTLLAIRYNPAITNFKYVSQENITNTIGGRYPVVRINGDTNYRQFTLTGTLSFQGNYALTEDSLDSRRRPMSTWFKEEEKSLYFKTTNAFANKLTDEKIKSYNGDFTYLEKKFRDIAMQFLTNKKPKIFRSNTEGCMLVSLSGISFTPNKQLGRNIYDFSATVTEFADYNAENLKKYGFNDSITQPSAYIMDATVLEEGGYATVPYPETENGLPVVVAIWE